MDWKRAIDQAVDAEWDARKAPPLIVIEDLLRRPERPAQIFRANAVESRSEERVLRVPPMRLQDALAELNAWATACFRRGEPISLGRVSHK